MQPWFSNLISGPGQQPQCLGGGSASTCPSHLTPVVLIIFCAFFFTWPVLWIWADLNQICSSYLFGSFRVWNYFQIILFQIRNLNNIYPFTGIFFNNIFRYRYPLKKSSIQNFLHLEKSSSFIIWTEVLFSTAFY